ncbi:Nuclear pore complex protein Nup85 [Trichostrongylus colubriformis]|uniref:Nuclear pore complex protein Nup85 n=1 Tax=Trichostrongylus colubriformis TaxID=6319 RepID=A0AAN8G3X6_TRICO
MLDHMADYVAELGSPSLSFLFNYCRFHRSLNAGDVRSDAPLLVSMITSPTVPQSFHKVLFGYLMLLLADTPQVQIPAENIYELISFFRQYTIDNIDKEDDTSEDTIRTLKHLLLIRLSEAEIANACAS